MIKEGNLDKLFDGATKLDLIRIMFWSIFRHKRYKKLMELLESGMYFRYAFEHVRGKGGSLDGN